MFQDKDSNVPDTEEAYKFLQILHPNGPHTIISLWPKGIEGKPKNSPEMITKTFSADQMEQCLAMAVMGNSMGWNLYVLINTAHGSPSKKPSKKDIKEIQWIFVDIDPRADKPLEQERLRILNLLTSTLPEGIPEPTLIVDSGSGYWAFWKLEQPITL